MSPELGSLIPIIEDFPHLLSGDQKWKGAADTLNKYPTDIIKNPILNISGFAPKEYIVEIGSPNAEATSIL